MSSSYMYMLNKTKQNKTLGTTTVLEMESELPEHQPNFWIHRNSDKEGLHNHTAYVFLYARDSNSVADRRNRPSGILELEIMSHIL